MKKLFLAALLALASAYPLYAQSVAIGNGASTVTDNVGRPVAGANVAICQPVATTAASVTNNLATVTLSGDPVTEGFATGATLLLSGFTSGDAIFNGQWTILS